MAKKRGRPKKAPQTTLTHKQELFCVEMLTSPTATEAYRKVYQPGPHVKEATISSLASRLSKNPLVIARIKELMVPVVAKVQITKERLIQELIACALANPKESIDSHGNCIDISEMPERVAAAIASYEQFEEFEGKGESRRATGYTRRFRYVDKLKAIELLGKFCRFFEDEDNKDKGAQHHTLIFIEGKPQPRTIDAVTEKAVTFIE